MEFKEVMLILDRFTAPPQNGDFDEHTKNAMRAVYDLMKTQCRHLQLLRISHLQQRLNISKSVIRRMIQDGDFPKPIRIGKNIDVWQEKTINSWFETQKRSVLPEPDLSHGEIGREPENAP